MGEKVIESDFFAIPIRDVFHLTKGNLYVVDKIITIYNPLDDVLEPFILLKNHIDPFPREHFVLMQNIINCLN